jgi:Peptidase family M41
MSTNGKIDYDADEVTAGMERLERARLELRAHFVGIDAVVDRLCDAITVWYAMPQVLSRPVIVNLWGMTGVGKTDLIRRLVRLLDIQDRFVEIELSNGDTTTWHSSVASRLTESGALEGRPTLLLFDEIQRFNTLDSEGKPLTETKFSDFWELLSDGRLTRREPEDINFLLATMMQQAKEQQRRRARGDEVAQESIGVWDARTMKRAFGLEGELAELSELSFERAMEHMTAARRSKRVYEPIDCSKCLIIISGNLDEAFTMAAESAEADIDPDIFHAFTSKITIVDVKQALISRFKPEQVARFGNVHLIYTSLRRRDFEELIRREVARVCRTAADTFDKTVEVSPAVHDLIYRNGVFPVQGVRPVFSSVADILEANLAKLLFAAIRGGHDRIAVDYDEPARELVATVGPDTVKLPYSGPVDRIRNETLADKVANVGVHEAGHAVAYAVLFGLAPLQLTARVASSYAGGFTFPHQIYDTSASLLHQVQVLLAGGLAEELVFGPGAASVGRNADRERATQLVIDFVRRYGFDREFQADYMLGDAYAMDRSVPEPDIEKLMTRLVAETRQLLSEHRQAVAELGLRLAAEGSLTAADVAAVLAGSGVIAEVRPEGFQWMPDYRRQLGNVEQKPSPAARASAQGPSRVASTAATTTGSTQPLA